MFLNKENMILATLIISPLLDFCGLADKTWRQVINIPSSKFFGLSGMFKATTTVYGWPDINIGEFPAEPSFVVSMITYVLDYNYLYIF